MKKAILCLAMAVSLAGTARADSIVVIDGNGYVTKQMFTVPTGVSENVVVQPAAGTVTTTTTTTTTAGVPVYVQTAPAVTVVRQSPLSDNSYYYDSNATNAVLAAGLTTIAVGSLIRGANHRPHLFRHPRLKRFHRR